MIEKRTPYPYAYKKAPLNSGAEIIDNHTLREIPSPLILFYHLRNHCQQLSAQWIKEKERLIAVLIVYCFLLNYRSDIHSVHHTTVPHKYLDRW